MDPDIRPSESNPDISIVKLSGRLGMEVEAELESALSQALDASPAGIICDMSDVAFVSSAGLRVFFKIRSNAELAGKKTAMIHLQPAVYKIFKLTAIENILSVFDSEAQALKAMSK